MWWQNLGATEYLLTGCVVWLAFLSFYIIRTGGKLKNITKGAKSGDLTRILEGIIEKQNLIGKNIHDFSEKVIDIQQNQKRSFTKSALVRFNPFEDTGGDQSFAVALLDGQDNGVVISSLHSRGGTRVYAKAVAGGKSTNYPFSKEEKEVVEKACHAGRLAVRQA